MRIVIPALALERGGGVRYLVALSEGLRARGHEVCFVVPERAPVEWQLGAPVIRVQRLESAAIPAADAIIPNFYPTVAPSVASGRGHVLRLSLGYEPLWVSDPEVARETYRYPVPLVTISAHLHDLVLADVGRTSVIVSPGIDPAIFHTRRSVGEWMAQGRRSGRTILYIYRSPLSGYGYKGQPDLWQALEHLRRHRDDLNLVLVTPEHDPVSAPLPSRLERQVSDARLAYLYRAADLFVSTSPLEAFSLPPLEAMACGTPVVAVDSGGLHAYVQPGLNALVVPPGRPDLLAHAMERALDDAQLRRFLADHGRATAAAFTWSRTVAAFDDTLEALVRGYLSDLTQAMR